MTRKIIYIIIICVVVAVGICAAASLLRPARTFRVVSMDGYGGKAGFSGKGLGCSMQTWRSPDGIDVLEASITYANPGDAQKDFDDELETATAIHERIARPDYRRVLATFPTPNLSCKVKLITLEDKKIRYLEASSLQGVIAFDRFDHSWFKHLYP